MLFNSFEFLIFLPIVFVLYWLTRKRLMTNNLLVVLASYLFYGWWDWRFLFLIFLTTVLSWLSGVLIDRFRDKGKLICGLNIAVNIAILGFFKYFNFFTDNLRVIFEQFGYQLDWFTIDVLLPVGISFYTFQALSYSIDVYRGQTAPTRDFVAFTAFISFFPQLVAGPIERSTQLLPQFLRTRSFDYAEAVSGMRQILWGFFKKLVIADNCAGFANKIFENYDTISGSTIFLGGLFFTFQIYGDFSGYSDIAVGTAKLFGIRLMRNFNLPYFSQGISDFWRRWHISLNKWFIDYVYIPLGGNRISRARTIVNILIVFGLSGLWHGADWTFVLWGLYNGILVAIGGTFWKNRKIKKGAENDFTLNRRSIPRIAGTFILVVIGWILFRSDNIEMALGCFKALCSPTLLSIPNLKIFSGAMAILAMTTLMVVVLMVSEYINRKRSCGLDVSHIRSKALRWAIYIVVFLCIIVSTGEQEEFIYFQF